MAIVGLLGVTSKSVRLPVQKGATWTGGGHRPMVLDRLLRQRLVPMCPGVFWTPNKFKRRVAHPWSWDIRLIERAAAQTSLNMVRSRRKARPFGLSTKLGLQENGRPSPKGTNPIWPGPYSMD